ncbi:MAG: MBL fold metallo-hydrolase [Pseudonocardiales bacterium]|nr:MAG: MBL fold metallo-hydrolase [Pseudonocardiales bacterium]
MQLTKFTHACVRLDDGDRSLVLDPGTFSEVETALDGAHGVLITHEHADHIDADRLRAAARSNPRMRIWAPAGVAATLGDLGEQVVAVGAGESFDAAGFAVQTFGGQHALIHSTIPVVANVAYLVEGAVYHPGDSLVVPPVPVHTLLAPIHAPWSKTGEVIDFMISVRAPQVHQIHDGLLNEVGLGFVEGHLSRLGAEHGTEFRHLKPSESVDL